MVSGHVLDDYGFVHSFESEIPRDGINVSKVSAGIPNLVSGDQVSGSESPSPYPEDSTKSGILLSLAYYFKQGLREFVWSRDHRYDPFVLHSNPVRVQIPPNSNSGVIRVEILPR